VPGDPQASTPQRANDGSRAPWLFQAHASFVGRQAELHQLKAAFEQAASGQGALIMLVGEPGIGKTALCEQLVSFISTRNGLALVGHSYPEGSARVPYQPFVEALDTFARQRDAETLRQELGSGVREVARVVPAIRSRLQVELTSLENPEDDRLRLLSGVLDCLRNIGAIYPLLLVLEDLHDADRGTLDLLVYLARHLADTPLLVVGTYRDVGSRSRASAGGGSCRAAPRQPVRAAPCRRVVGGRGPAADGFAQPPGPCRVRWQEWCTGEVVATRCSPASCCVFS
jgi:hypothetical protein